MNTSNTKKGFTIVLVAILSSVITLLGYSVINKKSDSVFSENKTKRSAVTTDMRTYADTFNQSNDNVTLASVTAVGGYPDFTEAAEKSINGVVHIRTTTTVNQQRQMNPFDFFFGNPSQQQPQQPRVQQGAGSGVIISADGYIITNNHVIDRANEVTVTLNDSREFTAKVVGTDPSTDIALLKIEGENFPYLTFGNSDALRVGEWVLAVGNPFNLTSTVTAGIVSAKNRGDIMPGRDNIQAFIQVDAAVNRGNSGGALVNTRGELVGINTAIYSRTGEFAGLAFAVPISIAGKVASDLKEFGAVQRAVLGINVENIELVRRDNPERARELSQINGVVVSGFADRSTAKAAGIEEGDIIKSINGEAINNFPDLQRQLSRFRPGDRVVVAVERNGNMHRFNVELKNLEGTADVTRPTDATPQATSAMQSLGATFQPIPAERRRQLGISSGVQVTNVSNQGLFRREGINNGFIIMRINNTPVNSESDIAQVVAEAANNTQDKVILIAGFYPNSRTQYIAIDLGRE
ncbi:MAG: Do family serine endopeptidase [Dysgonamonadaceae bacterium]|jgi:Do/DeqQ family serine protease|nr:Do family serine endopeptidase [Dysgonamonadaceae bacterium]